MHAAGHAAQKRFRRVFGLLDEVVHIVAAGKVQVAAQLAIQAVLHGHIHHDAALIHHGVQLGAHLVLGAVHAGQNGGIAFFRRVQLIAPGRCIDLRTACPQQSHIPHHDLARDPQQSRQCAGTDRCFGPAEPFQNGFSALRCIHGFQSFLSALRYYALIVAKDGGSCKNAFTFPAAGW